MGLSARIPDGTPTPLPGELPARVSRHESSEEILARFLADRSQEAFARLVAAHGPMVQAVCQRILRNRADADDAFQATFFVLARDADRVFRRGFHVASWLYGTACRVCKQAVRTRSRRTNHELRRAGDQPMAVEDDPIDSPATREAGAVIDDEMTRLPERYREPLVLCHVAGLTHDQAAAQLGLHPRTVERRLKAGLDVLRSRLVRRGVALSAAAVVSLLAIPATCSAIAPSLSAATAKAAMNYAGGAGATAPAMLAAATHSPVALSWWAAGAVAATVAAGIGLAIAQFGGRGGPVDFATNDAGAANGGIVADWGGQGAPPAAPANAEKPVRWFAARGRVLDADDQPVANATVILLSRPIRRLPQGGIEPIPDATATHTYRTGRFRELARGTTDADGRFLLTATVTTPDPATGAIWFQSLPAVVKQANRAFRIVDSEGEFGNMIWLPGVGVP